MPKKHIVDNTTAPLMARKTSKSCAKRQDVVYTFFVMGKMVAYSERARHLSLTAP